MSTLIWKKLWRKRLGVRRVKTMFCKSIRTATHFIQTECKWTGQHRWQVKSHIWEVSVHLCSGHSLNNKIRQYIKDLFICYGWCHSRMFLITSHQFILNNNFWCLYISTMYVMCNAIDSAGLTFQSVWAGPGWVDRGWSAECGYWSRQLSGTWATSWRTWWRGCSPASAGGAATEPCGTWTRSHPWALGPRGSLLLLLHWPPPAAQTPRCCPRPHWWGRDRQGCGPGKAERVRRWRRGSRWSRSRQRGGAQGWWSGTAVRSKVKRFKLARIIRWVEMLSRWFMSKHKHTWAKHDSKTSQNTLTQTSCLQKIIKKFVF